MNIFIKTVLFLTCSFSLASAQELLTFKDAIAMAMQKNHRIEIARNDAQIAENNVHIGNAGLLPRIDVSAGSNYQDSKLNTPAGELAEGSTLNTAQVQARYTLFDGFGNIYRFKRLQALGEIGRLQARSQIENTLVQVSGAYYAAALSFDNLEIAKELLSISRERLERAKKKSLFGQANTIQVLAAKVDLNADSVTVTQAIFHWDEAKRNLNVLLSRDVNADFVIDSRIEFPQEIELATVRNAALEQNAAFLISQHLHKQSNYDVNIARSARLPQVDFTTSYGYNRTDSELRIALNEPNKVFRAGATISLNLFDGFRTSKQIQNAKLELENRKIAEKEARLQLERDVANGYEAYRNARLVLSLEEQNLKSAQLNFKRTQELFNLGQVTTTQFREAQLNLIRAKNNISSAKFSAKLDEIELLRLSGTLIKEE